jgi:hypothetical protein
MKTYFRVAQGLIQEIFECENIDDYFHPDVGFIESSTVTGNVVIGHVYNEDTRTISEPVYPPEEPPVTLHPTPKTSIPTVDMQTGEHITQPLPTN